MNYNDYDSNNYSRRNNHTGYDGGGYGGDSDEVVSIGGWILILILTAIPFVNFIALLFMAFGSGNKNIKNYGKASLLVIAIPLALVILTRGCY